MYAGTQRAIKFITDMGHFPHNFKMRKYHVQKFAHQLP